MKNFQVNRNYTKLSLFLLAIIVSIIFNCIPVFAVPPISISGKVMDRMVIKDAAISILNISGEQVATVKTDALGTYGISNIEPGRYRIFVSSSGYSTLSRVIVVESSIHQTVQDFCLSPYIIAEQITVTASKGGATASVDIPQPVVVKDIREI
jgi:hypothetical protein